MASSEELRKIVQIRLDDESLHDEISQELRQTLETINLAGESIKIIEDTSENARETVKKLSEHQREDDNPLKSARENIAALHTTELEAWDSIRNTRYDRRFAPMAELPTSEYSIAEPPSLESMRAYFNRFELSHHEEVAGSAIEPSSHFPLLWQSLLAEYRLVSEKLDIFYTEKKPELEAPEQPVEAQTQTLEKKDAEKE